MALSSVTYTGDGSTTVFTVPFLYLDKTDVTLTVDDAPTTFSWITDSSISVSPAPGTGSTVFIRRLTSIESSAVGFSDGSTLTAEDLNESAHQSLLAIQELNDRVDEVEAGSSVGGGTVGTVDPSRLLPTATSGDVDSLVLVDSSGAWVKKTLSQAKTTLGISTTYVLPAPGSGTLDGLLMPNGGTWVKGTAANARSFLGFDSLSNFTATLGVSAFGTAAFKNCTSTSGDVVTFTTDGASAVALPAVSGKNLTGVLLDAGYVRLEQRSAYNVDAGAYPTALVWQTRVFTDKITDDASICTLNGDGTFTLPAGTYMFQAYGYARAIQFCRHRLARTSDGFEIASGVVEYSGTDVSPQRVTPIVFGKLTLTTSTNMSVQLMGSQSSSDTKAMGDAHNVATFGSNTFGVVEFWKLR